MAGTAQAGPSRSQEQAIPSWSHVGDRNPSTGAIMCCLPGRISKKMDRECQGGGDSIRRSDRDVRDQTPASPMHLLNSTPQAHLHPQTTLSCPCSFSCFSGLLSKHALQPLGGHELVDLCFGICFFQKVHPLRAGSMS